MSWTKASMINSSVRNSLISPEASWQRLRLMTERRAGERRLNRERESCIKSQKKRWGNPFCPPPIKKKKKITRVIKGSCICSTAEDLSSSFLVGEADSRREQDKEKSWSGWHLPGACSGQQRVKLRGWPSMEARARAGDGMLARSGSWSTVLVPPSCQTPRCAHLWRKVNPKSPLQKQFCSRNSEFVPRFNQTKEKKIFMLH